MDPKFLVLLVVIVIGQFSCTNGLIGPNNCTKIYDKKLHCITVDCSYKSLIQVPPNLPRSTCKLNLQGNRIPKLLNASFSYYHNLTFLNVSSNAISDMEAATFVCNRNLITLDLSNNYMSFNNMTEILFSPLGRLQHLYLSNNSYSDYPETVLSPLKSLESLSLDGFITPLGNAFRGFEKLRALSLSGSRGRCKIDYLSQSNFKNVPNITKLDVSYCGIYRVETGALSYLLKIETLDLSGNVKLEFDGIQNATLGLEYSKMTKLVINQIVGEHTIGVMVLERHIEHLQNSSLTYIEANDNRIEVFNENVFSLLPKTLTHANVRSSRFTYGPYLWNLQNLTGLIHLDLSGRPGVRNLPFAEPDDTWVSNRQKRKVRSTHSDTNLGYGHQHSNLNVEDMKEECQQRNDQTELKPFGVPPNLIKFKYTNSILAFALTKLHFAENSLRYIDVSYNIFTSWEGPIYGLENVTHLDLSGNIARKMCPDFFANFVSLQFLNISYNFLGSSFYNNTHGKYFRNQHNLEVLDMSLNSIMNLHIDFFVGLKSLRILNMSRNLIYNLSLNFENNVNLTRIICADNNVRSIEPYGRAQINKLAEKNNFSIDLSHNSLRCTCETIDFLDWFLNSKIQPLNLEHTYCHNNKDVVLYLNKHPHLLDDLKFSCRSYFGEAMGSMAAFVLVISLMVSAICYRYRWRLTYWYYVAKLKVKDVKSDPNPEQYEFDMFIAYADNDLDFVCRNMVNMLETVRGNKLYIRDRDALPGAPIAENIIDGIRRSKRTVLLLSKEFLKKKWCRYELHMANMESISTGRNVMVIVMLEDIPSKDIPPEILYDVQNSRFIDYPQDANEHDHFWANLHASIEA